MKNPDAIRIDSICITLKSLQQQLSALELRGTNEETFKKFRKQYVELQNLTIAIFNSASMIEQETREEE